MTETIPQEKVYCGFNTGEMVGYTQLYHDWLDDILAIDNLAEMKVVLYIFRHTCGFQEDDKYKYIPLDQFMYGRYSGEERMDKGTRLSKNSVRHALRKAEEDGYILCKTNSRDKARIKNSYRLRFQGE
jgi:hypothetical protein